MEVRDNCGDNSIKDRRDQSSSSIVVEIIIDCSTNGLEDGCCHQTSHFKVVKKMNSILDASLIANEVLEE